MPHRGDVETAADFEGLGKVRQVHGQQDVVGDAFGALTLEVMLGGPKAVIAESVHKSGHGLGLAERSGQVRVRIAPLVDGRAAVADVIEIGMTGKEAIKLGDHEAFPGWPATREGVILDQSQGCAKLPMPASTSAKNCGAGETHFPSGKMLIKKMIHCNVALLGGSASMVSCGLLVRCRSRAMAAGFLVSALRSAGTDHPARRRRARLVWRRERADALSHGIRLVVRAAMAAMLATWCCPRPCA